MLRVFPPLTFLLSHPYLQVKNLSFRSDVPQGIMLQLRWSKNIREERHAPTQVIFGSMDPQMCALLHLAVHCEQTFERTVTGQELFLFGCGGKILTTRRGP